MSQIKAIKIPSSQYGDAIILDEYNGNYSLMAGRQDKNDPKKIWSDWAFPQDKDRQPREKAVPVKVNLGSDKQVAADFLRQLADTLDGDSSGMKQSAPAQSSPADDDIPF